MGRLFRYQLRVAVASVRRRLGLSLTIVVVLSLAGGIWTFGVCRYLRHHGPYPSLSAGLHQVDLAHRETPGVVRGRGTTHTTAAWATHTRVSFPEYTALTGSGYPRRETGTFRSRVLVASPDAGPTGAAARLAHARFVNAAFFPLFALPMARGRWFSSADELANEPVVVLGERLAETIFAGADSIGRTLLVEGRRFRVVGTVAGDQPFRPTWDIAMMDRDQDALYLPFAWFRPLRARPDAIVYQSPTPPGFEQLLRSDALFVSFWVELPTPASRAAYLRFLDERFARRGEPYVLRSYAEWREAFAVPGTRVAFLSWLSGLLLLAAGFSATRLLLIKGISQRSEIGVRRALGASRGTVFAGQMLEAALLCGLAAAASLLFALPHLALFNHFVADTDIPVRLTLASCLFGPGVVWVTGLASALYPAWRIAGSASALLVVRG